MSTIFPSGIDNIPQFLNMTSTDASLVTQYQTAMKNGDVATANTVLSQITSASQKIINATRMNDLRDPILALEQFYLTDIKPYVDIKQAEWENILDLFSYIGTFNSGTQYVKNNIVSFSNNGLLQLYICTAQPIIGTPPTNTSYWRVFTIRGEKGDAGTGTSFDFAWDNSFPYSVDTIVTFDNSWWICTTANTNQQPFDGSSYWSLVLTVTQALYPISADQPLSQSVGELWFKVI